MSLDFNTDGSRIITGSFDHTVKLWDVATGKCVHTFSGHHGEARDESRERTHPIVCVCVCVRVCVYACTPFWDSTVRREQKDRVFVRFWVSLVRVCVRVCVRGVYVSDECYTNV